MKFTIMGFSQAHLVSLGLDLTDVLILRWFVDFQFTGRFNHVFHPDLGDFYQVDYQSLIDELPIIYIKSKRGLKKHFDKLVFAEVLESYTHREGGTVSCYRLSKNYQSLIG